MTVFKWLFYSVLLLLSAEQVFSQCTTLGQNPSTAFPVCGTSNFSQTTVPLCTSHELYVPGCGGTVTYENKNPFWYKFTCFKSGTLNFVIRPKDLSDDYDWQLYDITGLNPDAVYTNKNIIVTGNWSGSSGETGASPSGVSYIQCASDPSDNAPRFARSPQLIEGHQYLLLVSHFTNTQSGYDLSFNGGTAVITDPREPAVESLDVHCSGKSVQIKLNKKMKCNSLTGSGSEFEIHHAVTGATVSVPVNAIKPGCSNGFEMDELSIELPAALPSGNYRVMLKAGTDGNTILDHCDRGVPEGYIGDFSYTVPAPIPIAYAEEPPCASDSILLYFSKNINCTTIAPDGSNFTITGPEPVSVISANGRCATGEGNIIVLKLAAPIYTGGTYTVNPRLSPGGGAVIDECGQIIQPAAVTFTAVDTVSARFQHSVNPSCKENQFTFTHDGAHDVNRWLWFVDQNVMGVSNNMSCKLPSSSRKEVTLIVSNSRCTHTHTEIMEFDNAVVAAFEMPPNICPEDILTLENVSKGAIDGWEWDFGALGKSALERPAGVSLIRDNRERFYDIKLIVTNNAMNCSDTAVKKLRVLKNCIIEVPNAFTPNGDGHNDYFAPNNALKAVGMRFNVYNRWGQLVFSTADWQEKWDGKYKGIDQAPGTYVWFLEYTDKDTGRYVFKKGTVSLIR